MKCPVCNMDNGSDILFCQGCGRKIPRCPTCGVELTTRDKFCTVDGTRLSDDLLLLVPEESVLAAPVWTKSGGNAPGVTAQQHQGETYSEDTVRAGNGTNVPAFTDWEEKPVIPEAPKRAFCEKCGKRIAPGTRYCIDCDPTRRRKKNDGNQKMKIILIIMLILLLLAGLCAGGYALINSDLFDWDSSTSNRTEKEDDEDEDNEDEDEDTGTGEHAGDPTSPTEEIPSAGVEDPVTEPTTEPTTQPPVENTQPPMTPLNYWIENCDKQYLRDSDLAGFDKQMCVYARNAIYAKSGRMFNSTDLQRYFAQFDWYNPIVSPDRFSDSMLNSYQIANLNVILAYERAHGYN